MIGAVLAAVSAVSGHIVAAQAPVERPRDAPAMAGHDAEARARDAEAEALWRRLFFDRADREEGEAGVSCDHRRAGRPETIRGIGFVAVATDAKGRVRARLWRAPGTGGADPVADRPAIEARLRALLSAEAAAADVVVETRVFAWCR